MTNEKQSIDEDIKVVDEVANAEFERFVDCMDLDLDTSVMDEEDLNQFVKFRRKIILSIKKGHLVINDKGEACYTPQNRRSKYDKQITFHERTGASLMAMDGKKKNYDVSKTYAVMGDMCKVHPNVFAGLVGLDVKICEAIFALLMD